MMFWEILSFAGWIISGLLILWLLFEVIKASRQRNDELLETDDDESVNEKDPR